jgi:hypothetical protein
VMRQLERYMYYSHKDQLHSSLKNEWLHFKQLPSQFSALSVEAILKEANNVPASTDNQKDYFRFFERVS